MLDAELKQQTNPEKAIMRVKHQGGFTLAEIIIILIVIGLLLGVILKGQQLINSARVRNLASQNVSIQDAYYGFIDRFHNLPGDMTPATACTVIGGAIDPADCTSPANAPGGNGDGRINTVDEGAAVWAHLSGSGFLNGTFEGVLATSGDASVYRNNAVADLDVPANAYQGPILLAHTLSYMDGAAAATVIHLAYSFGGNIPVPILKDLDQKLDDGVAGTGVMRAGLEAALTGDVFEDIVSYDKTDGECMTAATWDVDSTNKNCNGIFLY